MELLSGTGPLEPLAETAPLAWDAAPLRCYRDNQTGETCLWYHRVWQYLRLLNIITTLRTNSDFLLNSFYEHARTGRYPRALISATADYSMLAHLAYAYKAARQPLDATVADRCQTSLLLNRWYAERYRVSLTTHCVDVVQYESERPYDLICTHNFLGRFDVDARRRLISRWHTLLRPGGIIVTTQRVRPRSRGYRTVYSEKQAKELSQRVVAVARASPRVEIDPEELGSAIYEYAVRKTGYVIRSSDEIRDPFEAEGFELLHADNGDPAERDADRPSSVAGKDTYRLRIVARRR